jgi:hypothetical protein
MKKIFAWLKWFLLNGSFLYIVYLALYEQITWAENVTMFFSHVFVFGLLMYSIVAAIDEKIKAEYRENKIYYYGIPANTPLHKIPISILNDIEEYEWECFGDSNKQYYRFEKTGKILVDTEIAENCKCILPFFYTHREPTFTGFMEFVQKKYGRK